MCEINNNPAEFYYCALLYPIKSSLNIPEIKSHVAFNICSDHQKVVFVVGLSFHLFLMGLSSSNLLGSFYTFLLIFIIGLAAFKIL